MSTISEADIKCQLELNHEGGHDVTYVLHKCQGNSDCPFCGGDRCDHKLITIQVWVKDE